MQTLKMLFDLLDPHERRHASLMMGMILVMAFLDMLGVASILPFMAVLANPELVQSNVVLNTTFTISRRVGIHTTDQFLFALGVLVFVLLVTSLAFKALTTYAQLRFTLMREYSIGKRLVEGCLHQPFSWFLNRHSADLGKTILSEVGTVIDNGVTPMMTLIAQGAVATALLMLLVLIDPKLALIVGLTLAAAYTLIFKATRGSLKRLGKERVIANQARFTAVSEAFGASKEVKAGGLEQVYIQRFSGPAQIFARNQATAQVISQLPRFALEAISFGGMLLVMLYLMRQTGGFAGALPIITLYAFAGYRLMPALQQIYSAVTQLRFAGPAIDALHAELMGLQPAHHNLSQDAIAFEKAITLNQIQYRYPNAPQPALKNLSLTIPAKSTVGLVGTTGSGKTTAVDVILGLLESQKGTLAVDG
ncbi:ABC transporter transmembrane domain-containing protein, partial [Alphaproteobacteria bacterium]|nr:ABC transporter transmembrane domain-containing protein [Alphaproteobacteria bacterium]